MPSRFTEYDIVLALLRIYSRATRSLHVGNVVGSGHQTSELERELGVEEFTLEERALAMQGARELQDLGLVLPTFTDLSNPAEWRVITAAGRDALTRGALDSLDLALSQLSPDFISMRRGAWRAANSTAPDALRQAAHSGRELVSQVLKTVSSDAEVRSQVWYNPRKPNEITRRDRYKTAILKRKRAKSETDLDIALKAGELMDIQHEKLSANAHKRGAIDQQSVHDALSNIDMVLRILLI